MSMDLNLSAPSSYGSMSSETSETWILVRFLDECPLVHRNTGIIRISPKQTDIFDNDEDFILRTFFKSIHCNSTIVSNLPIDAGF